MLLIVPDYRLWFNCPQIGALYIASALRKAGEPVTMIDCRVEDKFLDKIDTEIVKHSSIGITANVSHAFSGAKIAEHVRKKFPDKIIVWGGPYPSAEYKKLIPHLADIVVIGEGETQAVDICKGKPLKEIPGIAYCEDGKIIVNQREKYIDDLDGLEFPAWDLVDINKYNFPGFQPGYLMQTQRGCPFNCINCTTFIHGNKYRQRSIEKTVAEMEWLIKKFGAREIHFWDDNFTLNPERVKNFCEAIIRKGWNLRITLPNGIRADINDPEMFRLMRKAGFYYVNLAVESADQAVIDALGKKLDLEKVNDTLKTLASCGFRIGLLFMMGMPFDTPETLRKTVEFAASTPAHHAHFFVVTPFPGTKLYDMSVAAGGVTPDYTKDFTSFDRQNERFLNPQLSNEELRLYHRMAYRKFYTPARILKILFAMKADKSIGADLNFLLNCGLNILFKGHR